jgi:hypothetical protein
VGSICTLKSSKLFRILAIFGNYQEIFVKVSTITIKFHENPSNDSRDDACGQTDRHDEDKRYFLLLFIQTRLKTSNPT